QLRGYTVIAADKGGEALIRCLEHEGTIDLILTDVVMPEMSGPELSRRLLQLRPEMKVIFMSGYTDDTTIQYGLLNQGIEFLRKPFAMDDLARRVREVLDSVSSCKEQNTDRGCFPSDTSSEQPDLRR